jgi:hypothetical protein
MGRFGRILSVMQRHCESCGTALPLASAPTTLDVPTVVLGFPAGPGCAKPGFRTVDPVKESGDLPVHRAKHPALRLPRWIEIAKLT